MELQKTINNLLEDTVYENQTDEEFWGKFIALQSHLVNANFAVLFELSDKGAKPLVSFPNIQSNDSNKSKLDDIISVIYSEKIKNELIIKTLESADDLYGIAPRNSVLLFPLINETGKILVSAHYAKTANLATIEIIKQQFEVSMSYLALHRSKISLQEKNKRIEYLSTSYELMLSISKYEDFATSALELSNFLASNLQCERVAIGFISGKYLKLDAINYSDKLSASAKLKNDIESAMEEAIDQDLEIFYPPLNNNQLEYISRDAKKLSVSNGNTAVYIFPIRKENKVIAAVSLERESETPFSYEETTSIRLALDLASKYLIELHNNEKFLGKRVHRFSKKMTKGIFSGEYTFFKIAVIAVIAILAGLIFIEGDRTSLSPFVISSHKSRVISAPFDSFLKRVNIKTGDFAESATILGELDATELKLKKLSLIADKASIEKKISLNLRDRKNAEALTYKFDKEKIQKDIELYEYYINNAVLKAPISGNIVSQDISKQIGIPVKQGNVLFEIADLNSLFAEVFVSESEIIDVKVGKKGVLTVASYPGTYIGFEVKKIVSIAEVKGGINSFKVEVEFKNKFDWMRPGMEGIAKINLAKESYGWMIVRSFVNWVRMKLWI